MKVCAVQLNLKHCANLQSFIDYLEDQVFRQFDEIPDLIVFPENINYCLFQTPSDENDKVEISISLMYNLNNFK